MLHRITVCRSFGSAEKEDLKMLQRCFERNEKLIYFAILQADGRNHAEEVYIFDDGR